MKTYLVNLKKCLTCKPNSQLLFSTLLFGFLSQVVLAYQKPNSQDLRNDLQAHFAKKEVRFNEILNSWEKKYGIHAVAPLLEIAENKESADSKRYIALMGVGRLSGKAAAPLASKFLNDSSWMVRNAALELLQVLDAKEFGEKALPLLKDRALVVRIKALEVIQKLRPQGTKEALIEAVFEKSNYHRGKAQWIPQRALTALTEFSLERAQIQKFGSLLNPQKDPELTLHALSFFESTFKERSPGRSLPEQVAFWKKKLGV